MTTSSALTPAGPCPPPGAWLPVGATWVGNGKQALSLVARWLRASGVRTVLAPVYRCETMVAPLRLEGLHVELVAVGEDLLLDAPVLARALVRCATGSASEAAPCPGSAGPTTPLGAAPLPASLSGVAVLHAETYGNRADSALGGVLAAARRAGARVVLDATHSLLDGPSPAPFDAAVASLRKLLPVPDGAWLLSPPGLTTGLGVRGAADEEATRLGAALLAAESRLAGAHDLAGSAGGAHQGWAGLYREVTRLAEAQEAVLEEALTPVPTAPETHEALQALPPGLGEARAGTADRLRAGLSAVLDPPGEPGRTIPSAVFLVNPGSAGCVALRTDPRTAERLRAALAGRALWGPVTWERPSGDHSPGAWPAVVTLPTDHPHEVTDVVATVQRVLTGA